MSERVWTRAQLLDAFVRYDHENGNYPENPYEGEAAFEFLVEDAGGNVTLEELAEFHAERGWNPNSFSAELGVQRHAARQKLKEAKA